MAGGTSEKSKVKRTYAILITFAALLVVALVVLGVMIFNTLGGKKPASSVAESGVPTQQIQEIAGKTAEGVTVNGIDISGMTQEEAMAATAKVPEDLLGKTEVSIDVNGEVQKYSAKDLGLTTDYDEVMTKALLHGKPGSDANESGSFTVSVRADKAAVTPALTALKTQVDKQPAEASVQFMPWGYTTDGNAYQQDQSDMIKNAAKGKTWSRPDLVKIPKDQLPNKMRYQYWKNTKYVKDYIPADASISRFQYKDGTQGVSLNVDALADSIVAAVEKGDLSAIKAPVDTTDPTVKLEDLKNQTQLIASWTSSYSNHYGYERNWNVAKLSGIICGVVIQPDETWSINKEAGNRTVSKGWKKAPGIENGGYTQQPGGGVCQISSTTYNAALRSGLKIVEAKHHSIRSNYIPIGLDATISSGSPDLKIKNTNKTPIYIVSYVNPKDKNVTVEMYGEPVVDPQHGPVILDFTSKSLGSYGNPTIKYIYNTKVAPDDHVLKPGEQYPYAEKRRGEKAKIYKTTYDLSGKKLETEDWGNYDCDPINGIVYVYYKEGEQPTPTPTPTPKPTPTPTPTPKPTPTPTPTPSPSTSASALWDLLRSMR